MAAVASSSSAADKLPADLQKIVRENKVVVFSKSYCPYCDATKDLLDGQGIDYYVTELDRVKDGSSIQGAVSAASNQRTVPNVWIGAKPVGGNDALQAKYRSGELKKLLAELEA